MPRAKHAINPLYSCGQAGRSTMKHKRPNKRKFRVNAKLSNWLLHRYARKLFVTSWRMSGYHIYAACEGC